MILAIFISFCCWIYKPKVEQKLDLGVIFKDCILSAHVLTKQ